MKLFLKPLLDYASPLLPSLVILSSFELTSKGVVIVDLRIACGSMAALSLVRSRFIVYARPSSLRRAWFSFWASTTVLITGP
jgi:hypothetical protein